jgi:hypothetical protein
MARYNSKTPPFFEPNGGPISTWMSQREESEARFKLNAVTDDMHDLIGGRDKRTLSPSEKSALKSLEDRANMYKKKLRRTRKKNKSHDDNFVGNLPSYADGSDGMGNRWVSKIMGQE